MGGCASSRAPAASTASGADRDRLPLPAQPRRGGVWTAGIRLGEAVPACIVLVLTAAAPPCKQTHAGPPPPPEQQSSSLGCGPGPGAWGLASPSRSQPPHPANPHPPSSAPLLPVASAVSVWCSPQATAHSHTQSQPPPRRREGNRDPRLAPQRGSTKRAGRDIVTAKGHPQPPLPFSNPVASEQRAPRPAHPARARPRRRLPSRDWSGPVLAVLPRAPPGARPVRGNLNLSIYTP